MIAEDGACRPPLLTLNRLFGAVFDFPVIPSIHRAGVIVGRHHRIHRSGPALADRPVATGQNGLPVGLRIVWRVMDDQRTLFQRMFITEFRAPPMTLKATLPSTNRLNQFFPESETAITE